MDYIVREQEIIKRLEATNYAIYDGSAEEALAGLSRWLRAFLDYAARVNEQQIALPVLYKTHEGAELQNEVMRLDTARRAAHNNAIASLAALNRLCQALGVPPFADVDTADRRAVAGFVGDYAKQVFDHGIGR